MCKKWNNFFLEPVDGLLTFGENRPMEDGGRGKSGTLHPQTVAGCIRTLILEAGNFSKEAEETIGMGFTGLSEEKPPTGMTFSLKGAFFTDSRGRWLLAPPRDMLGSDIRSRTPLQLRPTGKEYGLLVDPGLSGLGILQPPPDCRGMQLDSALLPLANLCHLLAQPAIGNEKLEDGSLAKFLAKGGGAPPKPPYEMRTLVRNRISPSGVVGDDGVFTKEVLEFRTGCGIAGQFAAGEYDTNGLDGCLAALGGDNGRVRIHIAQDDPGLPCIDALKEIVLKAIDSEWPGYVVLYVATPLVVRDTWYLDLSEHGLKLAGAADAQKPAMSGWNRAGAKPKPMLRFVSPGCVFYYEVEDKDKARKLVEERHFESFSSDYGLLGHGLCLFGLRTRQDKESSS